MINTYRYKPYGAPLAKTGAGLDPRFLWTGDYGSRTNAASFAQSYNRARHFTSTTATWICRDDLWPLEPPFAYAGGNPVLAIDPYGTQIEHIKPMKHHQFGLVPACQLYQKRERYFTLGCQVANKMNWIILGPSGTVETEDRDVNPTLCNMYCSAKNCRSYKAWHNKWSYTYTRFYNGPMVNAYSYNYRCKFEHDFPPCIDEHNLALLQIFADFILSLPAAKGVKRAWDVIKAIGKTTCDGADHEMTEQKRAVELAKIYVIRCKRALAKKGLPYSGGFQITIDTTANLRCFIPEDFPPL